MSVRVNYILHQVRSKLNKLDSGDFDNIPDTKIITAYNEGRLDWLRRNLVGSNLQKAGDEGTKRRMDDFKPILTLPMPLTFAKKEGYYISQKLPENYFQFKKVDLHAISSCCEGKLKMICYLVGESNTDTYLRSSDQSPSFEWGETFCVLEDDRLKIYTNDEFEIEDLKLIYYRFPKSVEKQGVLNLETGNISTQTVDCEFRKDLVSLFIKETCSLLGGNIESFNAAQNNTNQVETNN